MRRLLILSVVCLTCTTAAFARYGSVRTKDGRMYEGDVREGEQSVQVARGTIFVQVARGDVASITYTGDTLEVMQGRLKDLKEDDVKGRLALARDAFRGGYYDLARQLANQVLDKDPNSKDAVDLLEGIRRQMLLEAKRAAAETAATAEAATTPAGAPAPTPLPKAYLTDEEINYIKQAELQPGDAGRVRIRLENNVARRYLALPQASPRFNQSDIFDQAMILIQTGDMSLRKDVIIVGDPGAVRDYRQGIQRIVINGCATSACHGSMGAGNFALYSTADSEPAAYTNFYVLATYQKKGPGDDKAVFGGASSVRKMIDRLNPSRSLLLQYGLPLDSADYPHPTVPLFRPVFNNMNDTGFRRVGSWIGASLAAQEPIYPVSYMSPAQRPATTQAAAATRPATRPVTPPPARVAPAIPPAPEPGAPR